jgi:hypothetical protein
MLRRTDVHQSDIKLNRMFIVLLLQFLYYSEKLHSADCHFAKCLSLNNTHPNVILLNAILSIFNLLNVLQVNVILLDIFVLNVILLNVNLMHVILVKVILQNIFVLNVIFC